MSRASARTAGSAGRPGALILSVLGDAAVALAVAARRVARSPTQSRPDALPSEHARARRGGQHGRAAGGRTGARYGDAEATGAAGRGGGAGGRRGGTAGRDAKGGGGPRHG